MMSSNNYLLLAYLFGAYVLLQASANVYETDDAVIIEGKCSYYLDCSSCLSPVQFSLLWKSIHFQMGWDISMDIPQWQLTEWWSCNEIVRKMDGTRSKKVESKQSKESSEDDISRNKLWH